jgi:hypothetical protein
MRLTEAQRQSIKSTREGSPFTGRMQGGLSLAVEFGKVLANQDFLEQCY